MPADLPIPIAIPEMRAALSRMYIELTLAFYATIFPLGEVPTETDANLTLVGVAVLLGHAEGRPMTARRIEALLHMPHSTTLRRLGELVERGIVKRIGTKYFLDPVRSKEVPHLDTFELILSKGFSVLGIHLSEMDK